MVKKEIKIKIVISHRTRGELEKTKTELQKTRAGLTKTVDNLSKKLNGIFGFLKKNPAILTQNKFSINLATEKELAETKIRVANVSTEIKSTPNTTNLLNQF